MITTRELYRTAHSLARSQGATHTLLSSERHQILVNLYHKFGVQMGMRVMFTYHPWRDLATLKYLFALLSWSHRSEDHWRALQREYGGDSDVANSAFKVYQYWQDLYYTESEKSGGMISIDESAMIVRKWHRAQENANWRQQYGESWRYTQQRAHIQICALARRSLGII